MAEIERLRQTDLSQQEKIDSIQGFLHRLELADMTNRAHGDHALHDLKSEVRLISTKVSLLVSILMGVGGMLINHFLPLS